MNKPRSLTDGFSNRRKTIQYDEIQGTGFKSNTLDVKKGNSSSYNTLCKTNEVQATRNSVLLKDLDCYKEKYFKSEESNRILDAKYQKIKVEYWNLKREHESLLLEFNKRQGLVESKSRKLYQKLLNRPTLEFLQKKNIVKNEPCFNTDLEKVPVHEIHKNVPKIVVECINLIENNDKFMRTPGIYRISGDHTKIQNLRYEINNNHYEKLHALKSPHEITGLLKLFIRELKTPLISLSHLQAFLPTDDVPRSYEDMFERIKQMTQALPDINKNTLQYIMRHLNHVAKEETQTANGMDIRSLSIVWGAAVFYETLGSSHPEDSLMKSKLTSSCMQHMIEHYTKIFIEENVRQDPINTIQSTDV